MRHPIARAGLAVLAALALCWIPGAAVAQDGHDPHAGHSGHDEHAHHQAPKQGEVDYRTEHGLSIPNVPVLTQDGEQVHFFDDLVKDKVVAMNFVFTTCTTICPPLGANFGKLQQELGRKMGREVRLISVSVDPVTDTPERLKAWGEVFGAGPGWTLVTGEKDEVTKLLKALQVFTPDIRDHSPVVLVGNAETGNWTRAYGLAPPKELAGIVNEMAAAEAAEGGAR